MKSVINAKPTPLTAIPSIAPGCQNADQYHTYLPLRALAIEAYTRFANDLLERKGKSSV